MKKKNLITLLMVGAMVGSLLTGCGGSSEPAETATEATEEVAVEEAVEEVATEETTEPEEAVEEVVEEPVEEEPAEPDYPAIFDEWITPLGETATPMYCQKVDDTSLEVYQITKEDYPDITAEASLTVTCDKVENEDGTFTSTFHYEWEKPADLANRWYHDWGTLMYDYNTGDAIILNATAGEVNESDIEGAEGFEGITGGFANVGGDTHTTTWDFYITAPDDRDIVVGYYNRGFHGDAENDIPAQEGHPLDDTAVYGANVNFVDNLDWFNQYKDWVVLSKNS